MTNIGLAEPVDFVIQRGMDFAMLFEPFQDDEQTVRAVLDGWVVTVQGRRHKNHPFIAFEWTTINGFLTIVDAADPPGKAVQAEVSGVDTESISTGGVYQMFKSMATDPSHRVPVYEGTYGVDQGVYRGA